MHIQILILDTDCLIQKHKKETTITWRLQKMSIIQMKEQQVLSRRDKLNNNMGIVVPGAMTRSAQYDNLKKRKKKKIQSPLFTCDGIHFFTSKKLVVLYEHYKDTLILSKLVRKMKI